MILVYKSGCGCSGPLFKEGGGDEEGGKGWAHVSERTRLVNPRSKGLVTVVAKQTP